MKDLESFLSDNKTTSGDIIKSFRKKFKISQKELCEVTGLQENNLSAIENGRREIGVQTATKIAAFFGFDPSFLLFPNGYQEAFKRHKNIRKRAASYLKKKKNIA